METVFTFIRLGAICMLWICLFVVAVKIVWNLCLPYAILKRGPNKGGVSFFVLIEIFPLIIAVALSFFSSQKGILAPWSLLVYAICAVVISYVHLFAVLFVGGFIMFCRSNGPQGKLENK